MVEVVAIKVVWWGMMKTNLNVNIVVVLNIPKTLVRISMVVLRIARVVLFRGFFFFIGSHEGHCEGNMCLIFQGTFVKGR